MTEIIKLERTAKHITNGWVCVYFELGNKCNYNCSYCPPNYHDGSLPYPSFDDIKFFLDDFKSHYVDTLKKKTFIQFTGGEPTVFPRFDEVLKYASKVAMVSIISNGSRTIQYWEKIKPFFTHAILTYHIEHASYEHFVNVCNTLGNKVQRIHLTMLPDRFDECLSVYVQLKQLGLPVMPKALIHDWKTELFPYTEEQKQFIHQHGENATRLIAHYEDGTQNTVTTQQLIVTGENLKWKGWSCDIGKALLMVHRDGTIYRGECREGGSIGHLSSRSKINWPSDPIICSSNHCSSIWDMLATRRSGS